MQCTDVSVLIGSNTVDVVRWKSLVDEERVHGGLVGTVAVATAWEELVKERCGSKEKEGERAEELCPKLAMLREHNMVFLRGRNYFMTLETYKVGVLGHALVPPFSTVDSEVLTVVVAAGAGSHHIEQGAIKTIIIS